MPTVGDALDELLQRHFEKDREQFPIVGFLARFDDEDLLDSSLPEDKAEAHKLLLQCIDAMMPVLAKDVDDSYEERVNAIEHSYDGGYTTIGNMLVDYFSKEVQKLFRLIFSGGLPPTKLMGKCLGLFTALFIEMAWAHDNEGETKDILMIFATFERCVNHLLATYTDEELGLGPNSRKNLEAALKKNMAETKEDVIEEYCEDDDADEMWRGAEAGLNLLAEKLAKAAAKKKEPHAASAGKEAKAKKGKEKGPAAAGKKAAPLKKKK